jgi:hypothetical protein
MGQPSQVQKLTADDLLAMGSEGEDVLPGFSCRVAELFPAP